MNRYIFDEIVNKNFSVGDGRQYDFEKLANHVKRSSYGELTLREAKDCLRERFDVMSNGLTVVVRGAYLANRYPL